MIFLPACASAGQCFISADEKPKSIFIIKLMSTKKKLHYWTQIISSKQC
jgi:hypothetical protein